MEQLHLLQATLMRSDEATERLAYLMKIDPEVIKRTTGVENDETAFSRAIDIAQAAITRAFADRSLKWSTAVTIGAEVPDYHPIYMQEGIRAWIIPVAVEDGAYLFLVG